MVVEKSYCENLDCQSRLLAFTAADFPSFLRSMLVNYEPTLHQEQRLKPCDYGVSDLYAGSPNCAVNLQKDCAMLTSSTEWHTFFSHILSATGKLAENMKFTFFPSSYTIILIQIFRITSPDISMHNECSF